MSQQRCEHTLYHRDASGESQGTWTAEELPGARRIACSECGKFYGFERDAKLKPGAKRTAALSEPTLPLLKCDYTALAETPSTSPGAPQGLSELAIPPVPPDASANGVVERRRRT